METKFETVLELNKQHLYEFGSIIKKKRKFSLVTLIGSLVFLFVLFPVSLWLQDIGLITSTLLMGVFFFLYSIFFDKLIGIISYKSMNKRVLNTQLTYSFDENVMHLNSALESSTASYALIEEVIETDNIFALFVNKSSAHLISKKGFLKGTPEEFRMFISERINKPVQFYKYKQNKKTKYLSIFVVIVWILGVLFGLGALRKYIDNRPKVFEKESYSIELTSQFIEEEESDYYMSAYTRDVYVLTTYEMVDEAIENWGMDKVSVTEYASLICENTEDVENTNIKVLSNGTACLSYTYEENDKTYYYCLAIVLSEDTYWTTTFICSDDQQGKYSEKFYEWAQTIRARGYAKENLN